ncbi:hypothetical protein SHELI_v1c11460 [Spiroplasma helicoides]|uniref:Lipoprotein n=1 Tax=Spiroplasma helicoides TaxID=216938 RepID=A0A1B3SMC8_9MOLU|nr:hypothetical protein [Spiroplasma helicoides]AOG61093.1 hypothetical protein SHELI_v1c11460 [Spiroplasma helicoides]
MKKLLYILSSVTFMSAPALGVISCSKKAASDPLSKDGPDEQAPDFDFDGNYTDLQNYMKTGAEVISRLLIASRHENLNFNINEILSAYLAPYPTVSNIPTAYKYKDKDVNLTTLINRYKNLLAPSIDKINGEGYAGVYASYIMGMYGDEFYRNFLEEGFFRDSFNLNGSSKLGLSTGDNNNAMGILQGLDKNLKLSNDQNRRNLAWGIQDTGALSNYLLKNGFDGGYPGGTSGTSGPLTTASENNFGTNGAGYLFYNSILANGSSKGNGLKEFNNKLISDKLSKNVKYSPAEKGKMIPSIDGKEFNKLGSSFAMTAGNLNLDGFINKFVALKDNVAQSDFGAETLLTMANYLTPFLINPANLTDMKVQGTAFSLLYNVQNAINIIQKDEKNEFKTFLTTKGFDRTILDTQINTITPLGIDSLTGPKEENVTVRRLYNVAESDKNQDALSNIKNISKFLKELNVFQNKLNEDDKKVFVDKFFKYDFTLGNGSIQKPAQKTPFAEAYKLIIDPSVGGSLSLGGLGETGWKNLVGENGNGASNLLNVISMAYNYLSEKDTEDLLTNIAENSYYGKGIFDLTRTDKINLMRTLGYDSSEKKFKNDTFLKRYYDLLTDKTIAGVTELNSVFESLKSSTDEKMKNIHENMIQYISSRDYWETSDTKISVTSPTETNNAKIEFTLNYKGVGDSESNADKQTTKVDVPENFNPYQTILANQKDFANSENLKSKIDTSKVSGVVLGEKQLNMTEDDIKKYDGFGNTYKNVNHKYKIVWQNISNNVEVPYWIIVDFKSYDSEGNEFFNIY